MSKKTSILAAALAAAGFGFVVALPARATHGSGVAQTVSAGLKVPKASVPVRVDKHSITLCMDEEDQSTCKTQDIPGYEDEVGTIVESLAIDLGYVVGGNNTHLPNVVTNAGLDAITCPAGTTRAGQKAAGVTMLVTAGRSQRFNSARLSVKVNGTEVVGFEQPIVRDDESPKLGTFGVGLDCNV